VKKLRIPKGLGVLFGAVLAEFFIVAVWGLAYWRNGIPFILGASIGTVLFSASNPPSKKGQIDQ